MQERLTKKQRGFVNDYVKTGNGTDAILAHYKTKKRNVAAAMSSQNLNIPKVFNAIQEALPDTLLAKVHIEGLEANKIISANITYGDADEKTNDFIEVPDHATRAKFLDMGYKVRGSYAPEKKAEFVAHTFSPEALQLADEILRRRKEKAA